MLELLERSLLALGYALHSHLPSYELFVRGALMLTELLIVDSSSLIESLCESRSQELIERTANDLPWIIRYLPGSSVVLPIPGWPFSRGCMECLVPIVDVLGMGKPELLLKCVLGQLIGRSSPKKEIKYLIYDLVYDRSPVHAASRTSSNHTMSMPRPMRISRSSMGR